MDELILLELEDRATPDQLEELVLWRRASEDHERRYQEIRALWALSGLHREITANHGVPTAADVLRPAPVPGQPRRGWRRPRIKGGLVAAAVATIVIAAGLGHLDNLWIGSTEGPAELVTAEFWAEPDEPTTAVLADGSVARLAPGSRLRATLGSDEREVNLEGHAFFAVAPEADRPFRVLTANGEAQVLGTRFEVDASRGGFRLLVVEGAVALSAGGSEAQLEAGEMAETSNGAPLSVSRVERPERLLGWMGEWVAFEATSLERVAEELEFRLGIRVEVGPDIAERTVTGWFAQEAAGDILPAICRVADVRCTQVGDVVHMER